ncbi:MAG: hypothetical protein V3W18_10095, partial [candidate division Zixibacteria bacterium]
RGNHTVVNNVISQNSCGEHGGGGIACYGGDLSLSDNTIISNTAQLRGGGIYIIINTNVVNCIIRGNSSGDEYHQICTGDWADPSFTYCDIEGGWEGEGNIDCDPQFCGPENDDFYLHTSSCCIGEGEGGTDIGALGVGCDYYCGEYIVGDFNGSGEFNVADIIESYSKLATGSPAAGLVCECPPGSGNEWAVAMDVNNSCAFNVADICIAYQRLALGQPELEPCEHCPPAGR